MKQLLEPVTRVFNVATVESMALRVVGAALVLMAAFWISRAAKLYLTRRFKLHQESDVKVLRFYYRVVLVIYRGIGGAIAVHTLGIDLTQADPQRPLSDPKETFQRAELLT